MTKQRGLLVLIIFLILVAALFWRPAHTTSSEISTVADKSSFRGGASGESPGEIFSADGDKKGTGTNPGAPATPEELASLKSMTEILAAAANAGSKEAELLKVLRDSKQEPFVADDNNPVTGDMDIIRTKSPLPGTRYFHAQYVGDAKTEKFMQHISFEFKPGPKALGQAIAAAQAAFHVGKPVQTRDNFYQWILKDGYCAWISPLAEKDLLDNPFNAYTPEDKGSIRVAVEQCGQED